MRYLVILDINYAPFYTNWMSPELYAPYSLVIDLVNGTCTHDGINWDEIERDHL